MFAIVVPFGKSFDDIGFTYLVPKNMEQDILPGQIVTIPFGKEMLLGVIMSISKSTDIDTKKIKEIDSILYDIPLLSDCARKLVSFISSYYFTPIHNALSLFIPKHLLQKVMKGKFDISKAKEYSYENANITLTPAQKKVYNDIQNADNKKILLYGVTGSGKTEIYIELINKYIKKGQQVLLMIPEIILSEQISNRIKKVFGNGVIVLNSTITPAQKTKYFIDIKSGNAKIILGTRSSLFAPFSNLACIIIDEEHDSSYISDQAPRYRSKDIAEKITEINGNMLLLASATPSIDSWYKAIKGEYKLLNLTEKYK